MKLPYLNKKSPVLIPSIILGFIFLIIIFIPSSTWNKIFKNNFGFATAFTSSASGDWKTPATWGITSNVQSHIQFIYPLSIAVSPITGLAYLSNTGHQQIVLFNPDGSASTTYVTAGGGDSGFGIKIRPNGDIYVAERDMGQIEVFNPDGTASTTYNTGVGTPNDVAFSSNGDIYVASFWESVVRVLNPDGTASTTAPTYTGANMCGVRGIDVSPTTGEIYTANECGPASVSVLNPDGTASTSYSLGMNQPYGIRFHNGKIYVTARGSSQLFILNLDGTVFNTYSGNNMSNPDGFDFGLDGKIYIANTYGGHNYTGHVTVLNPDGTLFTNYNYPPILIPNYVSVEGVDYPGINDNIILNSGTVVLSEDQNVNNVILAPGGTLDLAGHTLNVNGDWNNTGGSLINNGGTINFVSTTSQKIIGTNTFYNLTKVASTSASLLFDPINLTTVTGNLSLSGTPSSILSIAPNSGSLVPAFVSKIEGNGAAGFSAPFEISISPVTNKIYVFDHTMNGRIIVLNPDGTTASTTFGSNLGISFHGVRGSSVSQSGILYFFDNNSNQIYGLNEDGSIATTTFGSDAGLGNPYDFKISTTTGNFYIADSNNYRVLVLNSDGSVASTTYGSDLADAWIYPYHIAVSPVTNKIYVVDHFGPDGRIVVLNEDGTTASSTFGSNLGIQLHNIYSIDISTTGIIYVFDGNTNQTYSIDENGNLLNTNLVQVPLFYSQDLAVSLAGYIYIPDYNNGLIIVLNPDGSLHATYKNEVAGSFIYPQGITHDSFNNIYVSDFGLNNIQKFNSAGDFISFLDATGIAALNQPLTLAHDLINNIYSTDYQNHRIVKFDPNGSYSTSSPALTVTGGMAINDYGDIYLTTSALGEISRLDQNFNLIASTSSINGSSFNFNQNSISLDPTGNFLYIADSGNNRIYKLNASDFSYIASTTGPDGDSFSYPFDIVSDVAGNVYVSDAYNNRIIKLNSNLQYMTQWGGSGSSNGQFGYPRQMTIDSNNYLYVADQYNHRVQKFNLTTNFTPFNINYTGAGSTTFSYLDVSGSTNQSSNTFYCLVSCTNAGGNTNWVFASTTVAHHRTATSTFYVSPTIHSWIPPVSTTTNIVATSTSSTTPQVIIATTTPKVIATTTKPIIPAVVKPIIPKALTPKPTPVAPSPSVGITVPTLPTTTQTPAPVLPQPTLPTVIPPITPTTQPTLSNLVKGLQSIIPADLLLTAQTGISQTYLQTLDVLTQSGRVLKEVINTPAGSVVTKSIVVAGIVAGTMVSVSTILFANPLTFSEVGLIPTRVLGLLLGALGVRRKNRPWGTVYDSVTKRPIDPAYVTLTDAITGKEMGMAITDLDGRYSFSVLPGTYKILAQKTNYTFPSTKLTGLFDEVYNDLYHGGEITVTSVGEIITKNIPMDSQNFDWNEFAKTKMNVNTFTKTKDITWAKISKEFFIIGFFISLIALYFAPQPYNFIITIVYIAAYLLNYVVLKPKASGSITDKTTGLPLSFAIVKIFPEGGSAPILKKIADKEGKYYALVPKGNYTFTVEKKNDDGTYTEVYKSPLLNVEKGVVNEVVRV